MVYLVLNWRSVCGGRSYRLLESGHDYNAISVGGRKIYVPLHCFGVEPQENEDAE